MKSVIPLTHSVSIEIKNLILTFSHTKNPEDLKNLLKYGSEHFEEESLEALHQFLCGVKNRKFLQQRRYTDLFYVYALQMATQILEQESKFSLSDTPWSSDWLLHEATLCVKFMLKVSLSRNVY
jgi:hypothetical protein